jgi:hypothetical protein
LSACSVFGKLVLLKHLDSLLVVCSSIYKLNWTVCLPLVHKTNVWHYVNLFCLENTRQFPNGHGAPKPHRAAPDGEN